MVAAPPCKIHWCDALATYDGYCTVHYKVPNYDPRDEYERVIDGTAGMVKPPSYRQRVKTISVPVEKRPLIVAAEDEP